MLNAAVQLHRTLDKKLPTARLNDTLAYLTGRTPPPAIGARRFKIYYATQTGNRPFRIKIFCNREESLSESYRRYLEAGLVKEFELHGCPIEFELVGKPRGNRWLEFLRGGSLVDRLARLGGGIDIYMVPAEQKATRRFRCTTRPSARRVPGRAERMNSTRRSAVRKLSSSASTDQHAPPIAVSRSVVTIPPCTIGPDGAWKQSSGVASHSITATPSACSMPR